MNTKELADRLVAAYSRDDFSTPVEDYDFGSADSPRALIDQMARAGGFTATKLAHARDILRNSMAKNNEDGILNWLSFPACLCATGTRGFFLEAVKRKSFNVIITTCGTLDTVSVDLGVTTDGERNARAGFSRPDFSRVAPPRELRAGGDGDDASAEQHPRRVRPEGSAKCFELEVTSAF